MQAFLEYAVVIAIILAAIYLFFIPTMEAYARHHPRRNTIFHINFWLGWTVIGWIIAFIWSQTEPIPPEI